MVKYILDWIRIYDDLRSVCCLTVMLLTVLIFGDVFFMNLQAKNVLLCLRQQVAMITVLYYERITLPVNSNFTKQLELFSF